MDDAVAPRTQLPEQILTTEINGHLGDCRPSKATPASILPDDVLAYLFSVTSTSLHDFRSVRERTIRAASQVCMRWRSIALSYPQIWLSNIDYRRHSLLWIKELLRRSDPALIDFGSRISCIDLLRKKDDDRSVLELVLKHASRIRVFHFPAQPPTWELLCSDFLRHPAPNLEFFSLSVLGELGSPYTDTLFSDHAPRLRTFHVQRCAVDFRSPVLSQLTDLHVANSLPNVSTVFGLLELLQQMPSLRWLTLTHAMSGDTPNVAYPTIQLDCLKMLSIDGSFQETVMLITHILTPPLCCLRLRCSDVQFGSSQRHLWTFLQKMISCWEVDAPGRKLLVKSNQTSFAIGNLVDLGRTWEKHEALIHSNRPKPMDPILTLEMWPQQAEMIPSLILSVLALFKPTFPTTTYLALWLDYRSNDGTQVFLPITEHFRLLTSLKTLDLAHGFHALLFPLLELHSEPDFDSIICPELRSLRFLQSCFIPNSDSGAFAGAYVEWRRRVGFPIEQVNISECWIDLNYLRSLFPGVNVGLADRNGSDPVTDEE